MIMLSRKTKVFWMKLLGIIPRGYYCHFNDMSKICRYWSLRDDLPYQENGYCAFLGKSDWDINEECGTIEVTHFRQNPHRETHKTIESAHEFIVSLLSDQCKAC